jgi:hypothetical protein
MTMLRPGRQRGFPCSGAQPCCREHRRGPDQAGRIYRRFSRIGDVRQAGTEGIHPGGPGQRVSQPGQHLERARAAFTEASADLIHTHPPQRRAHLFEAPDPRDRLHVVAGNDQPPTLTIHVAQPCLGHDDPLQPRLVCVHDVDPGVAFSGPQR